MTRLVYRFKNWRSVARLIWHRDVEGWRKFYREHYWLNYGLPRPFPRPRP